MSHLGTRIAQVGTALVPVIPRIDKRPSAHAARANADFVAQLIATAAWLPQARTRRRAEPQDVVAAYAALDRQPAPSGHTLSRSL
jgi:hypothetical protein